MLQETDWIEELLTCLSLKTKQSSGYAEVSTQLLKSILHFVLAPLVHIINLSFNIGIVPKKLKLAKVVPIFKNGYRDQPIKYRLLSILSAFSKIIEKLFYDRIINFITKYNVLNPAQHGFCAGRSISDAIYNVVNFITKQLDCGNDILGIFIDVNKAFDSLSRLILLDKSYVC